MIRPRAALLHQTVWPLLLLAILVNPFGRRRDGPAASRRAGGDPRPVLHHRRADHLRDRREAPGGHARVRRLQRPSERGSSRSWSSSSSRARSRRAPASAASAATWPTYIAGLGGAKLTVAYVPTSRSSGYAVLPVIACTEIVMGPQPSLGPITPEGQPFDAGYREEVRHPGHAQDPRPRPAAGDARPRRRPPAGPHGRQGRALRPGREPRRVPEVAPGDRGTARVGRRPARRAHGAAGARGGLLQADRRLPGRAARASITSPASRPWRTRPSASCPARCGSTWKVRWIR